MSGLDIFIRCVVSEKRLKDGPVAGPQEFSPDTLHPSSKGRSVL